jgi:HEAT repeat protein
MHARALRLIQPVTLRLCAVATLCAASLAFAEPPTLEDYVKDHWWGIRRDEAASLFDASAVPALAAMLESESPYCTGVVGMLVAIGDERAVDVLIGFVEKPYANPSLASVYESARASAISGLGQLARRIGSERALTYLIEGLTPDTWGKRNVRGVAGWTQAYEGYDALLSEYAMHGLAYSGDPRAGQALRTLQRSPTPAQARLRKGLDKTLEQWLAIYDKVVADGCSTSPCSPSP